MSGTRSAAGAACRPGAACNASAVCGDRRALRVSSPWRLLLLAFLAADGFIGVLDALALIRLRPAICADFRSDLADPLLVGAGDRNQGRAFAGDLDVLRDRIEDIVAVTKLQLQVAALHRSAIADAADLKLPGEPGRNAGHHVVD